VEFKRLNPAGRTFSGGGFKISRPSGPKLTRDGLGLSASGRNYDVRREGEEIWLMDDERLVGYATGNSNDWHVLIDEKSYSVDQPKLGNNNSALMAGTERVAEITGSGFPLRAVQLDTIRAFTDEQKAFVVMIVLLGWRESDRSLFSSTEGDYGAPAAG
jgi:hypothetical protein